MEENGDISKKEFISPKVNVTTSIPYNLYEDAKNNNIVWSEALKLGLGILLKDLDIYDNYPDCSLSKKLYNLIEELEQFKVQVEALEALNKITNLKNG